MTQPQEYVLGQSTEAARVGFFPASLRARNWPKMIGRKAFRRNPLEARGSAREDRLVYKRARCAITTMSLRTELEELSPAKLIEALSIRIYEPPLSTARARLREIAEPLCVPILVLDFDTELNMNGMLSFLENSTGLYFAETIEAFGKIGASETVSVLRAIEKTLDRHGVTPSRLREDFAGTQEYQITTFRQLHGDFGTMPNEVEQDARRLYLYGEADKAEPVWSLLEVFVEKHRTACLTEIGRVAGG